MRFHDRSRHARIPGIQCNCEQVLCDNAQTRERAFVQSELRQLTVMAVDCYRPCH
jgi:hypothetical protein